MNAYVIRDGATTFTRISKHAARRLWGKETLAFCPVKLRPGYPWAPHVTYSPGWPLSDENFDLSVSRFEWYNCTGSETGTYTAFYTIENN